MTAMQQAAGSCRAGRTIHLLGNLLTFHAGAADTEGGFSLVAARTAPGAGSPPHIQTGDCEAFYVLEGRYEFILGGERAIHGPGAFVYIPKGVPHGFRNAGDTVARMLILNLPGGLHEAFFAEAGDEVADASAFPPVGAPDVPRLAAAGARYGITLLPPA